MADLNVDMPVQDATPIVNNTSTGSDSNMSDMFASQGYVTLPMVGNIGTPIPYNSAIKNLTIAPDDDFTMSPQMKSSYSKSQLPIIESSAKALTELSYSDIFNMSQAMPGGTTYDLTDRTVPMVEYNVPYERIFTKLNDGTWVKKYDDGYVADIDNYELYAQNQSGWSQLFNGIGKFIGKTGTAILGGTVGVVNGLIAGLRDGEWASVWNNDFSRTLDDWNTRMDNALPNFWTKEQRNRGVLGQMLTMNFWADDALGGLSFTTGAIISEGIWASVTGGASLGTLGARAALKGTAKGAANAVGRNAAKSYVTAATKEMGRLSRAANYSTLGRAANTLRFIGTSAGYEASVESLASYKEALTNFEMSYMNSYGRMPTSAERAEFDKDAIASANAVFAGNMAILAPSNMIMFGRYFNVSNPLAGTATRVSNAFNRKLGIGVNKTVDAAGKVKLDVMKSTRLQRRLGRTLNVAKYPLVEGVFEEGMQGVVNNAAQYWVGSVHNPGAIKENISLVDAFAHGFAQSFGTTEGAKEVVIGALIGALMGGTRGARSYNRKSESVRRNVETYNNFSDQFASSGIDLVNFTNANSRYATKLSNNIRATSAVNEAQNANSMGKSKMMMDIAQFSTMASADQLGLLDEQLSNFEKQVELMDTNTLSNELGISIDEAELLKENAINEYRSGVDKFKKSQRLAENVLPIGTNNIYKDGLALNIYLGQDSAENARDIGAAIGDIIGGGTQVLQEYATLSDDARNVLHQISVLGEEIETLNREITASSIAGSSSEEISSQQNERATRLASLNIQYQEMMRQFRMLRGISNSSFTNVFDQSVISEDDLVNSARELSSLEDYANILYRSNPNEAKLLSELVAEYSNQVGAYRAFKNSFERMTDPRFMDDENRSILSRLFNKNIDGTFTNTDDAVRQELGLRGVYRNNTPNRNEWQLIEGQFFDKNGNPQSISNMLESGKLTENEAYTLESLNSFFDIYTQRISQTPTEPISDEMWSIIYNNGAVDISLVDRGTIDIIANKLSANEQLSEREQQIYDAMPQNIDGILGIARRDRIDSILERAADIFRITNARNERDNQEDRQSDLIDLIVTYAEGVPDGITRENIERYRELNTKERLNVDEVDELNNLIGLIDQFAEEYMLGDLRTAISSAVIETNIEQNADNIPQQPTNIALVEDELINTELSWGTLEESNKDNLQSYNMGLARLTDVRDENGLVVKTGYIISNLSLNKIIDVMVGNDTSRVSREDGYIRIFTDEGDIIVEQHDRGRYFTNASNISKINRFTGMYISPSDIRRTSYQGVFMKSVENGRTIFRPVPSDFTVNGEVMLRSSVYGVKEGDMLTAIVNMNDSYNSSLWSRYQDAKQTANNSSIESAKQELLDGLVISLYNSSSQLVGVFKQGDVQLGQDDANAANLNTIRGIVLDKLLDSYVDGVTPQSIRMDVMAEVSKVYIGRPNIQMEQVSDGVTTTRTYTFDANMASKVITAGTYTDGTITIGNKKTNFDDSVLRQLSRSSRLRGRSIPFIVFNHNESNIAYPISLIYNQQLADSITERILNQPTIDATVIQLRAELSKFGLDQEIDLTEQAISNALSTLQSVAGYINMRDIVSDGKIANIRRQLIDNANININIMDVPFHSPKLKINLSKMVQELSDSIIDRPRTPHIQKVDVMGIDTTQLNNNEYIYVSVLASDAQALGIRRNGLVIDDTLDSIANPASEESIESNISSVNLGIARSTVGIGVATNVIVFAYPRSEVSGIYQNETGIQNLTNLSEFLQENDVSLLSKDYIFGVYRKGGLPVLDGISDNSIMSNELVSEADELINKDC